MVPAGKLANELDGQAGKRDSHEHTTMHKSGQVIKAMSGMPLGQSPRPTTSKIKNILPDIIMCDRKASSKEYGLGLIGSAANGTTSLASLLLQPTTCSELARAIWYIRGIVQCR
ncbi:uncharacterized protein PV07_10131 [Cladophialophora immunda]|uniref:Uncharacterized protein n=1 Tax=Cladophialophora immunda TaxID=569365 RepID=A0A0D2CLG7_9EURO|nr:uncharacterized protein PV07_10131 [Cladophialophora immunda]KIW24414.1 hypothetical protein PV07_10131 [Cladophialophora immunda]